MHVASGWYPDPSRPGIERYWDGSEWTDERPVPLPVPVRSTVGFELPSHEVLAQMGAAAADASTEKARPDGTRRARVVNARWDERRGPPRCTVTDPDPDYEGRHGAGQLGTSAPRCTTLWPDSTWVKRTPSTSSLECAPKPGRAARRASACYHHDRDGAIRLGRELGNRYRHTSGAARLQGGARYRDGPRTGKRRNPRTPSRRTSCSYQLLARGFRDEPLQIASLGPDPVRRHQRLLVLFAAMFEIMDEQTPLVAVDEGTMVGVTGVAPPGTCQPRVAQLLHYVPALLPIGLRSVVRTARVNKSWGAVDASERHSHLGPLAVDAALWGRGIGSQILAHYCRQLDEAKLFGYLETDSEDKVRLYKRFGFEVVGEQQVIGVPNWFMVRPW